MDGLIIKKEWLDLILSGKKTFEIRGSDTHKLNQEIYLLESGTHRVRGVCKIIGTKLMTYDNWDKHKDKACLNISFIGLNKRYHRAYAWELSNIEIYEDSLYYVHPQGAVIWVKDVKIIDEMSSNERLRYGY